MIKFHIYLASPLHTPEHRAVMDSAKQIVLDAGFSVFDPRMSGGAVAEMTPEQKIAHVQRIFSGNIEGLDSCSAIVACIDDRDTGVAFELGYMFAQRKVALITFSAHGHGCNVMLAQSAQYHCPTLGELKKFFHNHGATLRYHIENGGSFPNMKQAPSNG